VTDRLHSGGNHRTGLTGPRKNQKNFNVQAVIKARIAQSQSVLEGVSMFMPEQVLM
jgi:hypothetical protein